MIFIGFSDMILPVTLNFRNFPPSTINEFLHFSYPFPPRWKLHYIFAFFDKLKPCKSSKSSMFAFETTNIFIKQSMVRTPKMRVHKYLPYPLKGEKWRFVAKHRFYPRMLMFFEVQWKKKTTTKHLKMHHAVLTHNFIQDLKMK